VARRLARTDHVPLRRRSTRQISKGCRHRRTRQPFQISTEEIAHGAHTLIEPPRSVCRGRSGEWCSEVPPPSSSSWQTERLCRSLSIVPAAPSSGDECSRCRSLDRIVQPRGEHIGATSLAGITGLWLGKITDFDLMKCVGFDTRHFLDS